MPGSLLLLMVCRGRHSQLKSCQSLQPELVILDSRWQKQQEASKAEIATAHYPGEAARSGYQPVTLD